MYALVYILSEVAELLFGVSLLLVNFLLLIGWLYLTIIGVYYLASLLWKSCRTRERVVSVVAIVMISAMIVGGFNLKRYLSNRCYPGRIAKEGIRDTLDPAIGFG